MTIRIRNPGLNRVGIQSAHPNVVPSCYRECTHTSGHDNSPSPAPRQPGSGTDHFLFAQSQFVPPVIY